MKSELFAVLILLSGCDETVQINKLNISSERNKEVVMLRDLSNDEQRVIVNKGTERSFSGKFNNFKKNGVFSCRNCGMDLYNSADKFASECGWPSFDDEILDAVKHVPDADGRRIEIICAKCNGHLGHVFTGEKLTDKNVRHCVNSISLDFTPTDYKPLKAYFAGGCFWGVEYYLEQLPGVLSVTSGYMGGKVDKPTYKEVCSGTSGHIELVEVLYNPYKVKFSELAKRFFEIHDPTQTDGQGPDLGEQYLSVIFYNNEKEKSESEKLITILQNKGLQVATKLRKSSEFWPAEQYHQNYYERKGTMPYCHGFTKRF